MSALESRIFGSSYSSTSRLGRARAATWSFFCFWNNLGIFMARNGLNQLSKLVAPVGVIFEHVERRGAR